MHACLQLLPPSLVKIFFQPCKHIPVCGQGRAPTVRTGSQSWVETDCKRLTDPFGFEPLWRSKEMQCVCVCVFILYVNMHGFISNPLRKLWVSKQLNNVMAPFLSGQEANARCLSPRASGRAQVHIWSEWDLGVRRQTEMRACTEEKQPERNSRWCWHKGHREVTSCNNNKRE